MEAYLAAASSEPIPGKEKAGEEIPEALEWLYRIESMRRILGDMPLRAGGLLDQPFHFLEDLMWADIGNRRHQQVQEANLLAGLPEPSDTGTPVTIDLMEELGIEEPND